MSRRVTITAVVCFLGLAAALAVRPIFAQEKSGTADAKKFKGTWKGMMTQPGNDPFPVTIHVTEFHYGKWCGVLEHSKIASGFAKGKLLGVKFDGKKMVLAATIFEGRENCSDGITELTLDDDNTMTRVWIDPESGAALAVGKLKRQP